MNGVVAVMSDLFFGIRISDAAKRLGVSCTMVQDPDRALERIRAGAALVIVDLGCESARPLELIAQMKADPATRGVPAVGFVAHVQAELRQKAVEAGFDLVAPRSVFAQSLGEILTRFIPQPQLSAE